MQAALSAHFKQILRISGQPITYSDGTTTKSVAKAVRSKPRANQVDAVEDVVINSKNWEWLLTFSDLGIEPGLGHIITDADGVKYKVQPSNPNDLPYRWSDGFKTFMRIFTEQQ